MLEKNIINKVHALLMWYTDDEPLNGDEIEELMTGLKKLNGEEE